jgi:hypothetical protein
MEVNCGETNQPADFHVDPEEGKYYRVLWTRTLEVAVE